MGRFFYFWHVMNHKSYTIDEVKRKLEHYCAYQERCHKEVLKKLKKFRLISVANDEVMGHLIELGFLNETRFSLLFAQGKLRIKKWGKIRIERELKIRNISSYNINKALKSLENKEVDDTFIALATKKWSLINDKPEPKKKKIISQLKYKGWESERIYNFINSV